MEQRRENLVVLSSVAVESELKSAGLLNEWKDYYPGATIHNLTVCGLPMIVKDTMISETEKPIGYEVIGKEEFLQRYNKEMDC